MHPQRVVFAGALVIAALTAHRGQANLIPWSYEWNAHPIVVNADPFGPHSPPTGGITLIPGAIAVTGGMPGVARGDADIVAVNLTTFSFAPSPNGAPERFTNSSYQLNVTLTDVAAHASGSLRFAAVFNGTLTDSSADIRTTFTSPMTRSVVLGDNLYTVAIRSYTPPGPPSENREGTISAHVDVHPAGAPEPSSLMLAAMAVAGVAGRWLRRRPVHPQAKVLGRLGEIFYKFTP